MIWASERDGWEHLYLLDDATHRLKSITRGDWVVRSVQKVDEPKRQIWFEASGMNPGEDPYFAHEYRITVSLLRSVYILPRSACPEPA